MVTTGTLYSTSQAFRDIICETATRMASATEQPIELVETITLPDFGQRVVLRFGLRNGLKVSFEEADALESSLRVLAGSEYWVTLMGSCYHPALPDLRQRQIVIDQRVSADVLQYTPTRHSEHIRTDAQKIRERLNLTADSLVFEIEVPMLETTEEPLIRIVEICKGGEGASMQRNSEHVKVGDADCAVVYLLYDPSFIGCVKAYFMAERRQMALASYIAQYEPLGRESRRGKACPMHHR